MNTVTGGGGASKEQEETRETAYGIKVPARQPELFEGGALKPYQLDGLEWLKVSKILMELCSSPNLHHTG